MDKRKPGGLTPEEAAARLEALERENRELRAALAEAEEINQAKSRFLSSMSHDIRTPMNAIMGMTAIALSHIDEKARVRDCLDKVRTASSHMMSLVNDFCANGCSRGDMKTLLLLLNPFAPHMCEELWETMGFAAAGGGKMACQMSWPVYDESKTAASSVEMAVQVQGKLRGTINVPADSEEAAVVEAAKAVDKVARAIEGMEIVKVIHVKNKLVNLIVKPAK